MRYLRGKIKTALSEIGKKLPKNLLFTHFRGLSKPFKTFEVVVIQKNQK